MNQTTIFDMMYPRYKITKPLRVITLFSGYDSQCLALNYLGIKYEHWRTCEWAIKSIQALKDIHFENDNTDYSQILSKDEVVDILYNLGISSNYNEPMSKEKIAKLNEKKLRTIYNNIVATHNLVNIQQVKGSDLEIVDTDKYDYILTYSFPCQDLSLAGKGKGMSDTSTRSGMLWEVERILTECKELGIMPQVLLMENVPQVHSVDNMPDFHKWQVRLEELGYKSYWQDLIATDYGIPQTRNRCFMISILGDYSYTFPQPMPLELKLKDMLEDNVDEKYYLSDKMIKYISADNQKWTGNNGEALINKTYASTLNTNEGSRRCDASNYISEDVEENYNLKGFHKTLREGWTRADTNDYIVKTCLLKNKGKELTRFIDKANTLMARDYKGFGNQEMNAVIEAKPQKISSLYEKSQNEINDLKIRKLTPRECFRLMGVKDEDFEKVRKNQSDSSLYHLAGDSIVVNVLMAIFKELF